MKFEALLREYNNAAKRKKDGQKPIEHQENGGTNNKNEYLLDKPIDLPFYKCI